MTKKEGRYFSRLPSWSPHARHEGEPAVAGLYPDSTCLSVRDQKLFMTDLTPTGEELLPDLARFGRGLIRSGDIDPVYPVMDDLYQDLTAEQALWFTILYVAWYHLPSALAAFHLMSNRRMSAKVVDQIDPTWPTGIERRGHRGGQVIPHLKAWLVVTSHTTLERWFSTGLSEPLTPKHIAQNWRVLNARIQAVHGNGRWAAYKHCEILRRVHGLPVEAPDMGMRFSSGPREGLAYFFPPVEGNGDGAVSILDEQGRVLQKLLGELGLDVDIEELETILCNWKSMAKGKYYIGHDIDEMQEQISRADFLNDPELLWMARKASLPNHYLGELRGWDGLSSRRMKAYRDRGRIVARSKV